MRLSLTLALAATILLSSCVSKREYRSAQSRYNKLDSAYAALESKNADCLDSSLKYKELSNNLRAELQSTRVTNDELLLHLKDLSVISNAQAESIKRSIENISGKDAYIRDLQTAIARKDSLNLALVMNLKGAIGDLDDKDINIKIEKGVIYIDISDKMLFQTGRYQVTERARVVLGKVAKVLNAHPEIEFMVEGHTDNVPYHQGVLLDNWDLSVKRATSVIRILQEQYGVPPSRMTAAGRGEYIPIATNASDEGRASNRRTRIVILPQLDQFFKLLEKPVQAMNGGS